MLDKTKCFDIFYNAEVDGKKMYEKQSLEKKLKFKFNRNNLQIQLNTLKLLQSIRTFNGIFLIMAILKRIEVSKKVFMIDIEQGFEVFIPTDLQQNHLPMTYRYFDPIIQVIQE